MEDNSECIVDGNLIPADKPILPAVSRGLMYGDGVFETFRTYSGKTLFLKEHLDRLNLGCELLDIPLPNELQGASFKKQIHDLLSANHLLNESVIVRLQVWRDGKRGYQPDPQAEAHFMITASACPQKFAFPKLASVETRRIPSEALPAHVKLTNGINYILAAREASQKKADDALMQTTDGWISETTIANVFWLKDNTIFTPSTDCDLIPGITRGIILKIIDSEPNWKLKEGRFGLDQLWDAAAVWICNSVREILPVEQVDDHAFNTDNELLKELCNRFTDLRDSNLKPLVS